MGRDILIDEAILMFMWVLFSSMVVMVSVCSRD
jgi:hypothetical protein